MSAPVGLGDVHANAARASCTRPSVTPRNPSGPLAVVRLDVQEHGDRRSGARRLPALVVHLRLVAAPDPALPTGAPRGPDRRAATAGIPASSHGSGLRHGASDACPDVAS